MNLDVSDLLNPQHAHAKRLLDSLFMNGVAADLSETGCGKTYVAAWVCKNLNVPVVVVCPKAIRRGWDEVFTKFKIKALTVINYEKLIRGNTKWLTFKNNRDDNANFYELHFPKDALVILDEVHKCKGFNSKNSNFLIALRFQSYKTLMLSATAATNPLEMKSFGFATLLHGLTNFKDFLLRNGAYRTGRFGAYTVDLHDVRTQQAMRSMHNELFNITKIASRMTRFEFGNIFPNNRVYAECFDMGTNTDKINRVYEMMEREIAELEDSSSNYSEHVFAIMTKARRLAELLKVPTMVEWIENMHNEGVSPVCFVNYTDTVLAIKKKLDRNKELTNQISMIVGGQSDKVRNNDIDSFQNNTKRIMIANLAAGNAGINLHDLIGNAPRMSLISPSFSAINLVQALGRIHRVGGKTPCIQKVMFAAGTIEEHACRRVQAKINNIDNLNDGDLTSGIVIA